MKLLLLKGSCVLYAGLFSIAYGQTEVEDNAALQERTLNPIVEERQLSDAELMVTKKYQSQIDKFIAQSKQSKNFDLKDLSHIFNAAQKDHVPEQVIHQYVMDLVKAFPDHAAHIVHTVALSYGDGLHPAHVVALAKTALISHPTPYRYIPIMVAQVNALNECRNLGIDPDDLAVSLAQIAPDNPLSPVAVTNLPDSSTRNPNTGTPRAATNIPEPVFLEMFSSRVPLSNPHYPTPVSPAGGERPVF